MPHPYLGSFNILNKLLLTLEFFLCVGVCRGRLKHLLKKLIFSSLVEKKKMAYKRNKLKDQALVAQ